MNCLNRDLGRFRDYQDFDSNQLISNMLYMLSIPIVPETRKIQVQTIKPPPISAITQIPVQIKISVINEIKNNQRSKSV